MTNYSLRVPAFILLLLIASVSFAGVSDKNVEKLLDMSGLTKQVSDLPTHFKAGVDQSRTQGAPIPDAEHQLLLKSIDDAFSSEIILSDIRSAVKASLSNKEAKKLLKWYKSDVGAEITAAEEKSSSENAYAEMAQMAQKLMSDADRVAFAKRLDSLIGATDMAMDLQEFAGIAVLSAIQSASQPDAPLNMALFKTQIAAANAQSRVMLEQMISLSFLYSYKDIEFAKLEKYESFLREPESVKFNEVVLTTFKASLENAMTNWASSLAELFKQTEVEAAE